MAERQLIRIPIILPSEREIVTLTGGGLIEVEQFAGLSVEKTARLFAREQLGLSKVKALGVVGNATVRGPQKEIHNIQGYALYPAHDEPFEMTSDFESTLETTGIDEYLKTKDKRNPTDIMFIKNALLLSKSLR